MQRHERRVPVSRHLFSRRSFPSSYQPLNMSTPHLLCCWARASLTRPPRLFLSQASFFSRFTSDIASFANKHCSGRVVSLLEGGYSDKALTSGTLSHLSGFFDDKGLGGKNADYWDEEALYEVSHLLPPYIKEAFLLTFPPLTCQQSWWWLPTSTHLPLPRNGMGTSPSHPKKELCSSHVLAVFTKLWASFIDMNLPGLLVVIRR